MIRDKVEEEQGWWDSEEGKILRSTMPISGHAHGGLGLSLLLSLMELHPFSFSFFSFHFLSTFLGVRTRGSSQFLDSFVPQKHSTTSSFSTHPFLLLIFDKHK